MSEIKTAQERYEKLSNPVLPDVAFRDCLKSEAAELRAAYEALQKELAQAKEESQNYENAVRIVQEWNGQMTLANGDLRLTNAAQAKRIVDLEQFLKSIERYVNHHGQNPKITAQEALSMVQHHPYILQITKSYKDGVIPATRNPYAEIESLRKQVEALGHKVPTSFGFCKKQGGCLCGGDVPRVQHSCSNWVKSASKNGE